MDSGNKRVHDAKSASKKKKEKAYRKRSSLLTAEELMDRLQFCCDELGIDTPIAQILSLPDTKRGKHYNTEEYLSNHNIRFLFTNSMAEYDKREREKESRNYEATNEETGWMVNGNIKNPLDRTQEEHLDVMMDCCKQLNIDISREKMASLSRHHSYSLIKSQPQSVKKDKAFEILDKAVYMYQKQKTKDEVEQRKRERAEQPEEPEKTYTVEELREKFKMAKYDKDIVRKGIELEEKRIEMEKRRKEREARMKELRDDSDDDTEKTLKEIMEIGKDENEGVCFAVKWSNGSSGTLGINELHERFPTATLNFYEHHKLPLGPLGRWI